MRDFSASRTFLKQPFRNGFPASSISAATETRFFENGHDQARAAVTA
jgi:hypothetical protein